MLMRLKRAIVAEAVGPCGQCSLESLVAGEFVLPVGEPTNGVIVGMTMAGLIRVAESDLEPDSFQPLNTP